MCKTARETVFGRHAVGPYHWEKSVTRKRSAHITFNSSSFIVSTLLPFTAIFQLHSIRHGLLAGLR